MAKVMMVRGKDIARLIHQSLLTVILEEPSPDTACPMKEVEKKSCGFVREWFQIDDGTGKRLTSTAVAGK
jgi:hypothetical protein